MMNACFVVGREALSMLKASSRNGGLFVTLCLSGAMGVFIAPAIAADVRPALAAPYQDELPGYKKLKFGQDSDTAFRLATEDLGWTARNLFFLGNWGDYQSQVRLEFKDDALSEVKFTIPSGELEHFSKIHEILQRQYGPAPDLLVKWKPGYGPQGIHNSQEAMLACKRGEGKAYFMWVTAKDRNQIVLLLNEDGINISYASPKMDEIQPPDNSSNL